jgi:hypothetical protein
MLHLQARTQPNATAQRPPAQPESLMGAESQQGRGALEWIVRPKTPSTPLDNHSFRSFPFGLSYDMVIETLYS